MSIFCEDEHWLVTDEATADEPALQAVAKCTRRNSHDGHHCDKLLQVAWMGGDAGEELDCPSGYDHGQPPNRTTRRGNKVHPRSAKNRADYRPGTVRPY